jgi:hypothetical protein
VTTLSQAKDADELSGRENEYNDDDLRHPTLSAGLWAATGRPGRKSWSLLGISTDEEPGLLRD